MPIVINKPADSQPANPQTDEAALAAEIAAILFDKDGKLTLEGQVVEGFFRSLDWNDMLDDADVQECLDRAVAKVRLFDEHEVAVEAEDDEEEGKDDDKEKGKKDDEGKDKKKDDDKGKDDDEDDVEEAEVETLSGEAAVELVDEEDLAHMFLHYVHGLPESTLGEKAAKAAIVKHLGLSEEELVEFRRGDFAKARKTAQGKNKVTRMLMAMLAKQAIARAKPGQAGYKAPGAKSTTYTKAGQAGAGDNLNPNGKVSYAAGTSAGKKKYYNFVGKSAGKSAQGQAKSGTKNKKSAADIAAAAKKKASGATMKVAAKSGDAKAKAKAAVIAKKVPSGKGGKKSLVAHDTDAVSTVHEGAGLAAGILGRLPQGRMIVEDAKPAEKK